MKNWYLNSKFKLSIVVILFALGLLLASKIDSAQWVSMTTWTLGLYFGANVANSAFAKPPQA
jgi:hypothetical protein